MPTPHISAEAGAFAETVLMPGDPLRAKFIAEQWLTQPMLVTSVRNMYGFTGTYKGKRLSVMGHGMGIPSISIYATELIKFYAVKNLIRVGSCGAIVPQVKLGEIIVAMGASTDSKVNRIRLMDHDFAAIADYDLLERAVAVARRLGRQVHIGNVFASDLFYSPQTSLLATLAGMRILAVEMELAGLYGLAAEYGVKALGILTVSDQLCSEERLDAEQRQTSFGEMIEIALETASAC